MVKDFVKSQPEEPLRDRPGRTFTPTDIAGYRTSRKGVLRELPGGVSLVR